MEGLQSFFPIILLFVVMYFFMIRPQLQKAKKERKFTEDLKKGDRIVMKSGLHGKIFDFSEKNNAVIIETNAGKLTYDKSAISLELSQKLNAPAEKSK